MSWFTDWKIGTNTGTGLITRIFHRNKEFIIYELDNSGWFVFDSIDDVGKRFSLIQSEWTDATNLLSSSKDRGRYIGKLAGALKESLLGNPDAAREKLDSVNKSIIDYKTTVGRIEYLIGTFATAMLWTLVLTLIAKYIDPSRVFITKILFFGIIGGVLSVSLNIKSIFINIYSGDRKIHFILGSTRVIISIISSLIIYILVKGKFLFGLISDSNDYVFYALGALSGFSEALIPNLLEKVKNHTSVSTKKPRQLNK